MGMAPPAGHRTGRRGAAIWQQCATRVRACGPAGPAVWVQARMKADSDYGLALADCSRLMHPDLAGDGSTSDHSKPGGCCAQGDCVCANCRLSGRAWVCGCVCPCSVSPLRSLAACGVCAEARDALVQRCHTRAREGVSFLAREFVNCCFCTRVCGQVLAPASVFAAVCAHTFVGGCLCTRVRVWWCICAHRCLMTYRGSASLVAARSPGLAVLQRVSACVCCVRLLGCVWVGHCVRSVHPGCCGAQGWGRERVDAAAGLPALQRAYRLRPPREPLEAGGVPSRQHAPSNPAHVPSHRSSPECSALPLPALDRCGPVW